MKAKRECQYEVSARFVFWSTILLIVLVLQIKFCSPAHGQSIGAQLTYTSEGQSGAGLNFKMANGYGAEISHYNDVTWKREADTFTTQNGTILSLSKQLCPSVGINAGIGRFESSRHIGNNEWDEFYKYAAYQIGTEINLYKSLNVVFGVLMVPGLTFQIYSGASISLFFDRRYAH